MASEQEQYQGGVRRVIDALINHNAAVMLEGEALGVEGHLLLRVGHEYQKVTAAIGALLDYHDRAVTPTVGTAHLTAEETQRRFYAEFPTVAAGSPLENISNGLAGMVAHSSETTQRVAGLRGGLDEALAKLTDTDEGGIEHQLGQLSVALAELLPRPTTLQEQNKALRQDMTTQGDIT